MGYNSPGPAGAEDGVDVAVLDPQRVELLRTVFWDMTKITTATETVEIPASEGTPDSTKEVLTITITARTPDDNTKTSGPASSTCSRPPG